MDCPIHLLKVKECRMVLVLHTVVSLQKQNSTVYTDMLKKAQHAKC